MINLCLLISLMILPKAYPDGVRIAPGENKYNRICHYYLYQNQERLPFLILILTLLGWLLLATSRDQPMILREYRSIMVAS